MHVQMHLHLRQDRRVARWRDGGLQISRHPALPALIYTRAETTAFLAD